MKQTPAWGQILVSAVWPPPAPLQTPHNCNLLLGVVLLLPARRAGGLVGKKMFSQGRRDTLGHFQNDKSQSHLVARHGQDQGPVATSHILIAADRPVWYRKHSTLLPSFSAVT